MPDIIDTSSDQGSGKRPRYFQSIIGIFIIPVMLLIGVVRKKMQKGPFLLAATQGVFEQTRGPIVAIRDQVARHDPLRRRRERRGRNHLNVGATPLPRLAGPVDTRPR